MGRRGYGMQPTVTVPPHGAESSAFLGVCSVGGCADSATRSVLVPALIDGAAGTLEIVVCSEHDIQPYPQNTAFWLKEGDFTLIDSDEEGAV